MKKINLFLPITPYSLAICENLVKSHEDQDVRNVLVNPHGLEYTKDSWDEVYLDFCSREVSDNSIERYQNFAKQTAVFAKMYRRLKKFENTALDFYYVDLAHVLTNAIFFSFKNIKERYIIEDGLLNYYYLPLKGKMLSKKIANTFLHFIGLPTQNFDGDITGIEMDIVKSQHVYFPDIAYYPQKSTQISFKKHEYKSDDKIIILGQEPIINFIKTEEYLNTLERIIDDAINKEGFRGIFYYKPHHHGKKDLARPFLENKLGDMLVIVEDNRPIHLIIDKIKPSAIVSFGSSASLQLKRILPEYVKSYVYLLRSTKLAKNDVLEELFHKLNISITEIECH